MLEIAKLNSETSNNSIRLAVAMLAISIARLAAAAFIILVIATPLKLAIATPLKRSACKAIRSRAANSASWFNCIKGVLGELVNLIAKKF
jgi:hypothetical protein